MPSKNGTQSLEERIAKYESLIKQLEGLAKENLSAYQNRIRWLIVLAYAYLALLLLVCIGLLGLVGLGLATGQATYILAKGGWIVLVLIYAILRSLWIKIPAPKEGIELRRAEYPKLFGMLDEISQRLQSPSFNVVRLDSRMNASVLQLPRFGIFGGYRNYLIIGLTLLHALSPDEFRSVIAHEFGHLSENHSRFGNKIYRTRATWETLLESLDHKAVLSLPFTKFFQWYVPYFNAYTFVLARADEYVADRCAVELTAPQVFGNGLLRMAVAFEQVEKGFWNPLQEKVKTLAQPPARPFTGMVETLRQAPERSLFVEWMDATLRAKTGYHDTHPSPSDRLQAVGYSDTPLNAETLHLEPTTTTAAEFYLESRIASLTEALEKEWTESVTVTWADRYLQYQKLGRELQKLEQKAEPLTEKEQLLRISWTEALRSSEEALPLYQAFLESHPDSPQANYQTGRLLLEIQKDPTGVALLEKAMQLEPDSVFEGCKILYSYFNSQHREEEAEAYRKRYLQQVDEYDQGRVERKTLSPTDVLLSPNLKPELQARIQQFCASLAMIEEVYLVRKEVKVNPQKPFYVFFLKIKFPFFVKDKNVYTMDVLRQFVDKVNFPEHFYAYSTENRGQYWRRIKAIEGSLIYKKSR